ncbi:MAG TPA: hypothetical protein VF407_16960, partial [Polyangiaceae bacterium]
DARDRERDPEDERDARGAARSRIHPDRVAAPNDAADVESSAMSVEAIMEAPADPVAGMRERDVEAKLVTALDAATSSEERAHWHDELARHYARRTLYRRMNRHETAAMQALAEGPNGAPFAEALALYRKAMKAYSDRDEVRALEALRASHVLAVSILPERHWWRQRVTHTLAGRLGGRSAAPGARPVIDEIVELREALEREAIANCGPDHLFSVGSTADLAYAYKTTGRTADALARFDHVFHWYLESDRFAHRAHVLLDPIGKCFRAIGDAEGVARFENELLARDGSAVDVVKRSRLDRDPPLFAELERRAVEHAAPLFMGRKAATRFARAVAKLTDPAPGYVTAAMEVYGAVLALERELGLAPEEDDEIDGITYAHPLCDAEASFQHRLYERRWAEREAARKLEG